MTSIDRDDRSDSESGPGLTLVSLFKALPQAESAVRELKDGGFIDQQIGLAMLDPSGRKGFADTESPVSDPAAIGAVNGGLVGGLIGLLGSLLIPGVGPIVLGGVLASTLTGAGVGAATGGLIGVLVEMGVSETEAEHLDRGLREGGILLTVNAGSRMPEALAIIQRHGPDLALGRPAATARGGSHEVPDRRHNNDPDYSGPERRFAGV
jgi:hypothetical protein